MASRFHGTPVTQDGNGAANGGLHDDGVGTGDESDSFYCNNFEVSTLAIEQSPTRMTNSAAASGSAANLGG